jgi:hypothetical protein
VDKFKDSSSNVAILPKSFFNIPVCTATYASVVVINCSKGDVCKYEHNYAKSDIEI